jgi:hypothetical protein
MVESSLFSTFNTPFPLHGSSACCLVQEEMITDATKKKMEMAKTDFFMGLVLLVAKVQGFNQ